MGLAAQASGVGIDDARAMVCVGAVAGAHGIRGELRIKAFTADPMAVAAYGPVTDEAGRRRFVLTARRVQKEFVIAAADGVADRNAAEALRGTRLYVPRDRLPTPEAEEFYHADLIGLAVEQADGTPLGRVRAVHDFGAGDILEVTRPGAAALMLPFTREVVPVVDLATGRLVAELPEETGEREPEGAAE